ncbi:MAG: hypothetical protein JXR96_09600 [Deltaproteobacteria bacterium]|nr:hypothetical protein [Deltaproteobacteria bacterium]
MCESTIGWILLGFCQVCSVQERDVGHGVFSSRISPVTPESRCRGWCIFDTTLGSLRLTQRLFERQQEVLEYSRELSIHEGAEDCAAEIDRLSDVVSGMRPIEHSPEFLPDTAPRDDWIQVIAPGQPAMYIGRSGECEDVTVIGCRYTPQGMVYDLEPQPGCSARHVRADWVRPLAGTTRMCFYDLLSGELREE